MSVCLFLSAWVCLATAWTPGIHEEQADRIEKVTLQYRVARDAFAPSRFLAVFDGGLSAPLELTWDLPRLDDKVKSDTQDRQKKEFDDLIKKLEHEQLNGVEFECIGVWLERGFGLRLTSVPRLSEAGQRKINQKQPQGGLS